MFFDKRAGIVIGYGRLLIIDHSSAGHQPMLFTCGRWVFSFNGEIYNHHDIRV